MDFFYKIYGLTVKSAIELPEAYEISGGIPEVIITYGEMPDFIKQKRSENYYTSILLQKYKWFYFEGEGQFYIENGNKITIEPDATANDKHIRALILGASFGSILYQRDIISIHGSAVVRGEEAIIVSGLSGAGKSTVSTELRRKGCGFLADDTVALTNEGEIYANPAYPQQKICPDVALQLGYDLDTLIPLEEERDKYAVRLKEEYCPDRKKVAALVCLEVYKGDCLLVEEVKDSTKLEYILTNLYTYVDCMEGGMHTDAFKKCLDIARKVPVIRVQRPAGKNVAEQIADQVLSFVDGRYNILV